MIRQEFGKARAEGWVLGGTVVFLLAIFTPPGWGQEPQEAQVVRVLTAAVEHVQEEYAERPFWIDTTQPRLPSVSQGLAAAVAHQVGANVIPSAAVERCREEPECFEKSVVFILPPPEVGGGVANTKVHVMVWTESQSAPSMTSLEVQLKREQGQWSVTRTKVTQIGDR